MPKVVRGVQGGTGYWRKVPYKTPEGSTRYKDEWVWVTAPKDFVVERGGLRKKGQLPNPGEGPTLGYDDDHGNARRK